MPRGHLAAAALIVLVGTGPVSAAFDADVLRRLIVIDDREVAPIVAARVDWAGEALIVGGWEHWPDRPVILAHGAGLDVPWFPDPAHPPVFAIDAGGHAVAAWRRSGEGGVLLASLRLSDGRLTLLDPAVTCATPGPLIAMADGSVVAACPLASGTTEVRRFIAATPSAVLAQLPHPGCDDLVADGDGEHVLAMCPGDPPRAYRISTVTGLWAEADVGAAPRQEGLVPGVEFDRAAGRIVRPVDGERVILAEDVSAACGSPDGRAMIAARPDGLYALDAFGQAGRRLWGAAAGPGEGSLLSWSGDGVRVAHCRRDGDQGSVRLATLGTEEVVVRLRFPEGSAIGEGTRIWVAERFHVDAAGMIVEPVWATLKALLRVRQAVRTQEGVICTAVSEGVEGGVVERLTGSNDPPPGSAADSRILIGTGHESPAAWMYTFSADPGEGLAGWVEGGRVTGTPLSVTVTRKRLPPLSG